MVDFGKMLSSEAIRRRTQRDKALGEIERLMTHRRGISLSKEDFEASHGNSYFQEEILPYLDDEALIDHAERCRRESEGFGRYGSSGYVPCTSSEELLIHRILPELLKRLRRK